jgi:hypothetical protein
MRKTADNKIRSPKIYSFTSETIHQTDFPSPTHGPPPPSTSDRETVTGATRAAVIYHFTAPSFRIEWGCR